MAGGQISTFPIDFDRRPYNTLALPCERVIVMEAISREFRVALPWELIKELINSIRNYIRNVVV